MNLLEAIHTRRSIAQLRPDEVPREVIEQLLEAAVRAPNHKRAEPWRFAVFSGVSREKLANAFRDNYRLDHPDATPEDLAGPGEKSAKRVLNAPVTIVVSSEAGKSEVETIENFAAAAVATEHILLVAHALGLGAYWRTGEAAYTKPRNAILELIGASSETQIVAFLLIGYPVEAALPGPRAAALEKTIWFD
ncbi:MAG TPA: nitroreductase [Abditibacteriaceae bacterium]|jgi:nitroreductase